MKKEDSFEESSQKADELREKRLQMVYHGEGKGEAPGSSLLL